MFEKFKKFDKGDQFGIVLGVLITGLILLGIVIAVARNISDSNAIASKVKQHTTVQFEEKTCSEGAEFPCHEWATVSSIPEYKGYQGYEFEVTIWGGSNRTFICKVEANGIVKKLDDVVVTISDRGCMFERFVSF